MKKLIVFSMLSVMALLATTAVSAQIRKIPAAVTEAFKVKYPAATEVTWTDKVTNFMAAYELDGEKYEARFNSKGQWQSTENEIEEKDLPEAVKDGFNKSKYAGWTIDNITLIQLPGDVTQYRVLAVKNDLQKKSLLFNKDGRLLKDKITL